MPFKDNLFPNAFVASKADKLKQSLRSKTGKPTLKCFTKDVFREALIWTGSVFSVYVSRSTCRAA
jgi:hypothetical protein